MPKRIDVGCGNSPKEGCIGVDLYVDEATIKGDITKMESFLDNYVEYVYTAHLLEHLKDSDVPVAMSQIFRVLESGGTWEVEVPDLIWVLEDFLSSGESGRWGWKLQTIFGLQSHEGEYHRTGFSAERMKTLLINAGFIVESSVSIFSERYNQNVIRATAKKP